MLKTTKPKNLKSRQPSQKVKGHKIAEANKNAIDLLVATVAETRSLQNKYFDELNQLLTQKKVRTLSPQESAALLEVFKLGPDAFESKNRFLRWLNYSNISLGGKTPLTLMLAKKAELVRDELLRIEYGIAS